MRTSTNRRSRLRAAPAILLAGGVVLMAAACAAVGSGPTATPVILAPATATPSPSPTATPVPATPVPATPSPSPVPTPKPTPSDPGTDGMPITVILENATKDKVYVDVVDQSGKVVSAVSGHPGAGAAVPQGTFKVENVDSRTLRLTWSDVPGDNGLGLYIDKSLTHFVLVQPEHDGDTIGYNRILILKFSGPVSARYIKAVLQNDTDTVG
jgi:hypothetical protein